VEWFRQLRERLGASVNKSAKEYCVPKRLLAAVIANEMLDWDKYDGTILDGIKGGGIGYAQISIDTAIGEGVTGVKPPGILYHPSHYRGLVQEKLQRLDGNIEIAARLMRKYLNDLCQRAKGNTFGPGLRASALYSGCSTDKLCCSGLLMDCLSLLDYKPSPCLLGIMAAYWNSSSATGRKGVLDALDEVKEGNYNAPYYMGAWIHRIVPYLDDLVP